MRPTRLLPALVSSAFVLGCGARPPRAADTAPLAIAPAQREHGTSQARPKRPDEVALWVHVEDPDAIVELSGMRQTLATVSGSDEDVATLLRLVDITKPIDLVATTTPPKKATAKDAEDEGEPKPDIEVAARFWVRDVAGVVEALGKEFDVRSEGGRIVARKKKKLVTTEEPAQADDDGSGALPSPPKEKPAAKEEDDLVCDFGGVRTGAEFAVCGTARGVVQAGPWLRTGPRPAEEERARGTRQSTEIARMIAFAKALRPWLEVKEKDTSTTRTPSEEASRVAMKEAISDLQAMTFEVAREGEALTFAAGVRFATKRSVMTRALFQPTSGVAPTDAFFRIAEDASGSVFLPGGGPVASLVHWAWQTFVDESVPEARPRFASVAPTITRMFDRPLEAGYGIDVPRVRTALARVRAATKDQKKAATALDRALEGYQIARLPIDVASVEALARTWVTTSNAKDKEKKKATPPSPSGTAPSPFAMPEKTTTYAIRTVPAKLALPKGTFVLDETTVERTASAPKTTTKTVESTFFVPAAGAGDKSATWLVTCYEDAACAERAKKALAEKPPSGATRDPLFDRPGLLAAGHSSTLMGAFALHRMTAKMSAMSPSGGSALDAAALAEIEHHLSEAKQYLPYVIVAEEKGEGGLVAFEVRGSKESWKTVGEHMGSAAVGSASLLFMMFALSMASSSP